MRISKTSFEKLSVSIKEVIKLYPNAQEYYKRNGFSDKRFRWDCLWASKFNISDLYSEGLNDEHIDTALRDILNHKT